MKLLRAAVAALALFGGVAGAQRPEHGHGAPKSLDPRPEHVRNAVDPTKTDPKVPETFVYSFSGGGARAALGSMSAMEWIENMNGFEGTESINGLSGGSWGTVLFNLKKYGEDMLGDVVNDVKKFEFPDHEWGAMNRFSRLDAIRRKMKALYEGWRDDTIENIFVKEPIASVPVAKLGKKVRELHKFELCSFFSDGPKKDPTHTCKWCAGHDVECFRTSGVEGRITADFTVPAKIAGINKPNGLFLDDLMTITSSAWTFVAKELELELSPPGKLKQTMKLSDAGIDCNLPFDPDWVTAPDGKRRNVLLFDFSDTVSFFGNVAPLEALESCVAKWNSRFNLGLEIKDVFASSTRINADGSMATKAQRQENKARAARGEHLASSTIKRVACTAAACKNVEIYWVQFRGERNAELIKNHRTMTFFKFPRSYSLEKIDEIHKEYRDYLSNHVQSFLGKRISSTGMSTIGVANLFKHL